MTTTNEALILTENFDSKPTETTQHGDSVDEFPFTVSSSTDTASEGFQEESYEHSNKMGRLPQKTINEEEQSEVHIPLHIPKPRTPEYQTEVLQQWEGIVETVGNESFTSRLRDLTNKEYYPREIAELPIEDISDDDQELLQEGAVFYLDILYFVVCQVGHLPLFAVPKSEQSVYLASWIQKIESSSFGCHRSFADRSRLRRVNCCSHRRWRMDYR